jgi:hypothetical protein
MKAYQFACSLRFILRAGLIVSSGLLGMACNLGAKGVPVGAGNGGAGAGGAGGAGGTPSDAASAPSDDAQVITIVLPDAAPIATTDPGTGQSTEDASVDGRLYRCDDAGNCSCLAILSLGQPGQTGSATGNNGDTNAFQTYMDTNTNATMTILRTFTHLTDSLLSQYDVVILQALQDQTGTAQTWTYDASDVAALEKWVRGGGAIIAMSGYGLNTAEVNPVNQLLAFSGISFGTDNTFSRCPNNLCSCTDNSVPFSNWLSNYADNPAITHDLKAIGIYYGRSVNCSGSGCQVFATDPSTGGGNVGVAEVIDKGRVLAWGDEWVTYTSQWGLTATQWDDATAYPQCVGHTAQSSYSVPQFWNNVFKWVAPAITCFTITQPSTPGQQIIP